MRAYKRYKKAFKEFVISDKYKIPRRIYVSFSIMLKLIGLFFLSVSFTGNVVADVSLETSSLTGVILILIGATMLFFYSRLKD